MDMKDKIKVYISENLGIDDEATFEILYESFRDTVKENLEKLEKSEREKDAPSLRSAAHALKGCAANVGAEEIRQASYEIEMAAKNGELAPCAALIDRIKISYAAL